jgi:ribosomal protein L11 methylase PrmA
MLVMVGETSSGSCPAPAMLLGQSEASKLIDASIHLWCGTTFGTGAAATTSQCRFWMMRQEVMSQQPLNMT